MTQAVLWGAAGMTGGELFRLCAAHPDIHISRCVSRRYAGRPLWEVHPFLRPYCGNQVFCAPEEALNSSEDFAFLALPHGASLEVIPSYVERGIPLVDLSADLRLRSPGDYPAWYGGEHPAPELLKKGVYGLPELHREEIARSSLVSGVGCNATAAVLGLYPLARAGVIQRVQMEMRVGSSEGGGSPSQGSHHPYRRGVLRVVTPFRHRHLAEVLQETGLGEDQVTMTLTAVEMVRGVQMLARVELKEPLKEGQIWKLYRSCWKEEPFIDLSPSRPAHLRFPDPRNVLGSNRAQIGFALHENGKDLLVGSALDNLMKGAAGTALQAANLMLGYEETRGLDMVPVYPC